MRYVDHLVMIVDLSTYVSYRLVLWVFGCDKIYRIIVVQLCYVIGVIKRLN